MKTKKKTLCERHPTHQRRDHVRRPQCNELQVVVDGRMILDETSVQVDIDHVLNHDEKSKPKNIYRK